MEKNKAEQQQGVFQWLKTLPLAPEYRPTPAEFQDPVAYIFKIEKEASQFGICKIIPPVHPQLKKTSINNLNRSLAALGEEDGDTRAIFSTREQQIGFCPRKATRRPAQRAVRQSGEWYTVQEFEAKAKGFEKRYAKKLSKRVGGVSALEMESMYWKATVDKPFTVEVGDEIPGSAFVPVKNGGRGGGKKWRELGGDAVNVGETGWNLRGVSRSKMSLLRFLREEMPGATMPILDIAMMFSWFGWHAAEYDMHRLSYLHLGAAKTWYAVPGDAAAAFEEVVRVQGYGGEINPLVTFSTLREKTTVMSPEIFVKEGIPCCRLVQNPGEFVVTFPRAYHTGFCHGFNVGEAANFATPEWLRVAKEAAARRASINLPPMASHAQLLYDLALALCSRISSIDHGPRSSRLKDKRKSEGEAVVKELFVHDVLQVNDFLINLGQGSFVVLLPETYSTFSVCSESRIGSLLDEEETTTHEGVVSCDFKSQRVHLNKRNKGGFSVQGALGSLCKGSKPASHVENYDPCPPDSNRSVTDQRVFVCVACGVSCFPCFAIVQPNQAAERYLMSTDCSSFKDHSVPRRSSDASGGKNVFYKNLGSGWREKNPPCTLNGVHCRGSLKNFQEKFKNEEVASEVEEQPEAIGALGLLASAYANSSDSEEEQFQTDSPILEGGPNFSKVSADSDFEFDSYEEPDQKQELSDERNDGHSPSSVRFLGGDEHSKWDSGTNITSTTKTAVPKSYDGSSQKHIFCLEHALEVVSQLQKIGGALMLLLCYPDYPKIEAEAKIVAEELGLCQQWNKIAFRDATEEDEESLQSVLDSEGTPGNEADWAVKLCMNLSYSADLSRSAQYSKEIPDNCIIYNLFGHDLPVEDLSTPGIGKRNKQKRIKLAGKWCGKVWMSHQVHPLLLPRDQEEPEEEDRMVNDWPEPDEPTDVEPESAYQDDSDTVTDKLSGKRKIVVYSRSNKRAKVAEKVDAVGASHKAECSNQRRSTRIVKSRYMKSETLEQAAKPIDKQIDSFMELEASHEEDMEVGPSTRLRKINPKFEQDYEPEPPLRKLMVKRKANKTRTPLKVGARTNETRTKVMKLEPAYRSKKAKIDNAAPPRIRANEDAIRPRKVRDEEAEFRCDIENCTETFESKHDLLVHKQNICPVKGCAKDFFSHKYLIQHKRVHIEDRPLKCPWKGCSRSFKWAWARTEHIRVHTGARPYICAEPGCGQTFRFVSDFSRHKRKTGHSTKKMRKDME